MKVMADRDFLRDAAELAHRAVECERLGNYPVAIQYYNECVYLLERAASEVETDPSKESASSNTMNQKALQYKQRALDLHNALREKSIQEDDKVKKKSPAELQFEKAYFLTSQALENDEAGNKDVAVELYTEAVSVCIEARSLPNTNTEPEISQKLNSLATQALERAEALKGISNEQVSNKPNPTPVCVKQATAAASTADEEVIATPGGAYSEEEKLVLLRTSRINGIEYVPFLNVDLKERFNYSLMFEDKHGLLKLSHKQRQNVRKWARPDELFPNPKMIERIDSFSIKQTLVSDCSFVASLAILANYEKKFGKKLIRNIIYPQDRHGEPIVNPFGKYMVKLLINGVRRKVIIDDLLPIGSHGELLCSYSSQKGELWVSLLEKAYMKVMGGYEFPGSNSNIDMHALTGWIPERLSIANIDNREKTFNMLMTKIHEGQVLLTVATGEIDERVADRAGLVPTHAYAVLDIQEVRGVRLFLLKNPWSHLRWRGNYSELDAVHWTDEMKRAMRYDPSNAAMFDNGVFWIDYESICKFFDVFYMSWNPAIFHYSYCVHRTWSSTCGPIKDVYSIGDSPQYNLEVNGGGKAAVVWVLLTRHITDIIDFKENREYITVLVYDTEGRRVYYPHDPSPLIDGVRINSPHYLCKIVTPADVATKRYTLVVSQYEKTTTIHYTLRVYASVPFKMGEIANPFKFKKKLTGEWRGLSAGGCANHPDTYLNNPCYRLELKQEGKLLIEIKAPKDYQVGFDIICTNSATTATSSSVKDASAGGAFYKKSSGPYRPGFVIMEIANTPAGIYQIIPSTFSPGCNGNFFLSIQSTTPFEVKKV